MRVLVAGATGRLGRELVPELKRRGVYVRALGRDSARLAEIVAGADELVVCPDFEESALRGACRDLDYVVSCVGASVVPSPGYGRDSFLSVDAAVNLRLIDAARASGIGAFVYISVFSEGRQSANDFVKAHEDVVQALKHSGMGYIVIRPTGFFSSLAEIMLKSNWGLLPESRYGVARTNPIHEADLAAYCADLMQGGRRGEYSVGGPEALTSREIANLMHGASTRRRAIRVPVHALRMAAWFGGPANRRVSELMRFIAGILSEDCVAPAYGNRTLRDYVKGLES